MIHIHIELTETLWSWINEKRNFEIKKVICVCWHAKVHKNSSFHTSSSPNAKDSQQRVSFSQRAIEMQRSERRFLARWRDPHTRNFSRRARIYFNAHPFGEIFLIATWLKMCVKRLFIYSQTHPKGTQGSVLELERERESARVLSRSLNPFFASACMLSKRGKNFVNESLSPWCRTRTLSFAQFTKERKISSSNEHADYWSHFMFIWRS